MKKLRFAFLLAIFLFGGCHTEAAETIETTAAPEIEAIEEVEEIEETASSESDFLYTIINNKVTVNQYIGGESVVVIPETIEDCPVQKVKSDFLRDSHVTEVTYPANFTVFAGLSNCPDLKIVRFSSSPEQITDPFSLCEGLTEIDIPDGGVYRTDDGIVYTADGKTLVAYPRGRTGSFTVPDGVEVIGSKAFYASGLSEIVLSDNIQTIKDCAFTKTEKLTEVTIPASVRTIGGYAFSESGIEQAALSEGLEEIGAWAFKRTKITELYLPDSLVKCGSGIAEPEVLISASYPVEGLKPLLLHENLEFRDETTLQEAFRKAEEQFFEEKYPMGYIFMDLSGDRFPELLAVNGNYMRLYYFDEKWRESLSDIDWWGSVLRLETYHLCYSEETDTYIYYSDPYDYYPWWGIGDESPVASQDYICFTEGGITTGSLSENEIKDLNQAEILQTVDFPQMLADWNADLDDLYKKFIFVTDSFAEEPNGEMQQKSLEIRRNRVETYPYFEDFYPKELHLSVADVDLLHGGEIEGVSFNHGVLTLENAVIDSSGCNYTIKASNLNKITIELIGENKIVSDTLCSLIHDSDMPVIFKGNGSLEAPMMYAREISLTEGVKITGNPRISAYHYDGNDIDTLFLSLSEKASLECRKIKATLTLTDDSRLDIQTGRCSSVSLSDNSEMNVETIEIQIGLRISGNARFFADNSQYGSDTIVLTGGFDFCTISDNGSLEIKGNRSGMGIWFSYCGTLTLNGNARVKISDSRRCICAQRIELNGGTLDLNAAEGCAAIELDDPPAWKTDFEPGYFINGEIFSETPIGEIIYNTLCNDGKPISNYFIQVREREQASE